jgi:DNA-binding helix-hairpin-helix protein with protein kinase domain/Flp pilus assembly protein TadD
MTKIYYDSSGERIELMRELGRGGEGTVYSCAGRDDVVGKIYHTTVPPEKQKKLRLMAAQTNPKLLAISAWIVDTLHDRPGGETVGLLMPPVKAKEIHELYSLKSRRVHFPNSDWRFLIHSAINLAKAVYTVHAQSLVIGDVNHGNFVVLPDGIVKLIDCDSYHFEYEGEVYPCEVGMTTHIPPELQGRSLRGVTRLPGHDNFGLAVIIFQLLFLGRHPFSGDYIGAEDKTLEESIKEKRFAYGPGAAARNVRQPPGTLPLEAVSGPVADLFERAFLTDGARPSAAEWIDALTALSKDLKRCKENVGHHYLASLAKCPWCEIELQTGIALFPVGFGQPETTGFNVLTIEEMLKSINIPSKLALTPMKQASLPPVSPALEPARRTALNRIGFVAVLQAALIIMFTAMAGLQGNCMGIIVMTILGIGALTFSNRELRLELRRKRDAELKNFKALEDEWKSVEDVDTYADTKKRVRNRLQEYKALPQLRLERLKKLRDDRYQKELDEFLGNFRIDEADIKGIGETRTAVLMSLGITTAADVKASRILGIGGFGNAHTDKLVDWRQELERTFQVDPGRIAVTPEEKQSIETEILKLRARYEREIQDSTRMLRKGVTRLASSYETLRSKNSEMSMALAQAERNLKAIDTRPMSAAVSAAVGFVLFVGGVAVQPSMRGDLDSYPRAAPPAPPDSSYTRAAPPAPYAGTTVTGSSTDADPYPDLLGGGSKPYEEIEMMSWRERETVAGKLTAEGIALTKEKNYKAAEIKFKESIRHSYNSVETFYELGTLLGKMKKYEEAARALENGVGLDANYRDIKELLGMTYISGQDWDGAKYIFEDLYAKNPKIFKHPYNLGRVYRNLGETSTAISMLEYAAELKPADADCHYELGQSLIADGRYIEAEREFKRLKPLDDRLARALRREIDAAKFNY